MNIEIVIGNPFAFVSPGIVTRKDLEYFKGARTRVMYAGFAGYDTRKIYLCPLMVHVDDYIEMWDGVSLEDYVVDILNHEWLHLVIGLCTGDPHNGNGFDEICFHRTWRRDGTYTQLGRLGASLQHWPPLPKDRDKDSPKACNEDCIEEGLRWISDELC